MLYAQEVGKNLSEICLEYGGISESTFYNGESEYRDMLLSGLQRVKELESENALLKSLVTDS